MTRTDVEIKNSGLWAIVWAIVFTGQFIMISVERLTQAVQHRSCATSTIQKI